VCDTTWNCISLCNCNHQFSKNIPVSFDFITTWNQGVFLCSPCTFCDMGEICTKYCWGFVRFLKIAVGILYLLLGANGIRLRPALWNVWYFGRKERPAKGGNAHALLLSVWRVIYCRCQLLRLRMSVIDKWIYVYLSVVEWHWQEETEFLGKKFIPLPPFRPQITHRLLWQWTLAFAVSKTEWGTPQLPLPYAAHSTKWQIVM